MQKLSPIIQQNPNLNLVPLANTFGIIYQINDDYLNLQSDNYSKNKGYCEDLTEGKFSFPIIHSIRQNTNNKELLNILKQKTTDPTIKKYAVDYMHNVTNSFGHAKVVVDGYAKSSRDLIDEIAARGGYDTSKLSAILEKMLKIA